MKLSVLILMFVLAVTLFTSVEAGWWGGDKTKKKTKVKIIIKETEKGRQENTKTEGIVLLQTRSKESHTSMECY
ncbi:hypothetical protein KUTeg_015076 [Tegillarca granosa]|uniref:Uncharacterized protein n=1 Tax=Tegillarca granosa TaxID=220873 RepID=A0ABQ9ESQ8_TEGGR|nr:hypothetical protein KUTeg_015076 [Tegillarca granosa]